MQKVFLKKSGFWIEATFKYEGRKFGFSNNFGVSLTESEARRLTIKYAQDALNMLALLGLKEYERQLDLGILGMHDSYDEKKLKKVEFRLVTIGIDYGKNVE